MSPKEILMRSSPVGSVGIRRFSIKFSDVKPSGCGPGGASV